MGATRKNRKQCRKVGYKSAQEARTALREQKDIGVKRFYKCPHCRGLYHLTSESR
jgi:hypothetical protein